MSTVTEVKDLQELAIERTVRSLCFACMILFVFVGWIISSCFLLDGQLTVGQRGELGAFAILYALVPAAFMGGVGRFMPWSVFEHVLSQFKVIGGKQ